MADLISAPPRLKIPSFPDRDKEDLILTDNFDEGLYIDANLTKIPENALSTATNVVYNKKQPFRRNGLTLYSITKPNSNKVLKFYGFYNEGTGINLLRFTKNTIHKAGSSGWTNFPASAIPTMTGTDYDFFSCTLGDNRAFFSNGGVDPIREIDCTAQNYKALGNAPRYKYITTGFNRIIGAAFVDPLATPSEKPYQVGWCGDQNYGVWDIATDISAGSTPLIDSPSDINDDITGIFTYANILILPRIRSSWVGISQPSATQPFVFYAALPTIGADIPRATILTEFGLCWFNYLSAKVYIWEPSSYSGNKALDIGGKVARSIKRDVIDPNYIWASYSKDNKSYSLFIGDPNSSAVIEWTFNFEFQVWTKSSYVSVWSVDDLDFASSSVTIDELTGTIDNLVGTIESLSGLVSISTRFFGFTDGEIRYYGDYFGDSSESTNIKTSDDGTTFTTTIAWKILEAPIDYLLTNIVRAAITPYSIGTVNLQYSKDDGTTWTTAKSVTFVSGDLNKGYNLQLRKAIRAKRIVWRITTTNCMIALNGFYVKGLRGGLSK